MDAPDASTRHADVMAFKESVLRHVRYSLGKDFEELGEREIGQAVSLAVRDRIIDRMLATDRRWRAEDRKRVAYLSMEFLVGRSLGNNLINLGLDEICRDALVELGLDLEEVREGELDAALGNGGLGRLAACFLDSLATLDLPACGYGINYEFGLFRQEIHDGWQVERPDAWTRDGTPWLLERPDEAVLVPLYGQLEEVDGPDGKAESIWVDWDVLIGVPHDMPVVGYGGKTVNKLRLYSARASDDFDMSIFNQGDYIRAVRMKMESETVSKVLYPSDSNEQGRELRLVQEYFFVACAIRDILLRFGEEHDDLALLPEQVAIQLNDTHPALAVLELMRVLLDEHGYAWDEAWTIVRGCIAYTNHTLLPEALETWPVGMLERVLPRHTGIVREIDARLRDTIEERWPGDAARVGRMAILHGGADGDADQEPVVRMAHLALVGSHAINGVAALHSKLLETRLLPDFHALWPERFQNKTNGITPRRWLLKANPRLARLVDDSIGEGWVTDLERLAELEPLAADACFRETFTAIKRANKRRLAEVVRAETGISLDPHSIFDVQAKRIHEYKRQLLLAMSVIHDYLSIVEDGHVPATPRSVIVAGKAAPGYWVAKQIIKLFGALSAAIEAEPRVREHLRVAFVPDYRVSLAERLIPAADLSEQISTAGMEASGTGNMKFALNGALTIGTYDGATIEMCEQIGEENMYLFGMRAVVVVGVLPCGADAARATYEASPFVRRIVDSFGDGRWAPDQPDRFAWLVGHLLEGRDRFLHLPDLESYLVTQDRVARDYLDATTWTRKAILNVARIGRFSSDRTIRQYAEEIWGLPIAQAAPR